MECCEEMRTLLGSAIITILCMLETPFYIVGPRGVLCISLFTPPVSGEMPISPPPSHTYGVHMLALFF